MARSVEAASREHEVRQLGYRVQRWPEMDNSPEAAAEDMLDAVERAEALSEALDLADMEDAGVDPSALEPRRIRGAGNEPRAPYHSDPLEERRHKWPSNSAHIGDGRAVYLREDWEQRFEKQFEMAGNWRVQAAGKAILGGSETLDQFHRDFSNRRPNPLMVQDVRENVAPGQEPEWFSQMGKAYTPAFRYKGYEYEVVLDGEVVEGPFPDRDEAKAHMVEGGAIEQQEFDLAYPERITQPIDEAEPYTDAAMSYVRADPALFAVVLGQEGPLILDAANDPGSICAKVCERLVEDHRALCLDHPGRALAVETAWQQTRDKLRDSIPEASAPALAKALLDQADDVARTQAPLYDRLRYQAAVGFAVGRTGPPAGALPAEATERLAPESSRDIPAGVRDGTDYVSAALASEASDPHLAKALLDQAADQARTAARQQDNIRSQAAVGVAAGRTGSHAGAFRKEMVERLADECYPDIHAGIAAVDPASPLAVRPAGAGAAYDSAALVCVVESAVAACQWDWEARGSGRWVKDQVVFNSQEDLVVDLLDLEQSHVDQGRLGAHDSGPVVEGEFPTGVAGRASAQVASVLAALEERGVDVLVQPIEAPRAVLEKGSTVLAIPSDWVVQAPDLEPLQVQSPPSLTDSLASGAAAVQVPGVEDTKALYRQVGVASLRAFSETESNFSDREVLYKVHRVAGKDSIDLATRQLEHFAARMTNKTWGLTSDSPGSPEPWKAPGRLANQSDVVDRLVDKAAAVDARLLTGAAAQSADRTFSERRVADRAVERLSVHLDRLSAAGMNIEKQETPAVIYRPDSRLVKDQRDSAQGPAQDLVVVPQAALDRRQSMPSLIDAHSQVHAAVARAVGHPARADRQSAVTLGRAERGVEVPQQRLVLAHKRESAHLSASVAQQMTKSWRHRAPDPAAAAPIAVLDKKELAALRSSERWVRKADVAPSRPAAGAPAPAAERTRQPVPAIGRGQPPVQFTPAARGRGQQPVQSTHAVVRPEVRPPTVPAAGRNRVAPIQGPIGSPGR